MLVFDVSYRGVFRDPWKKRIHRLANQAVPESDQASQTCYESDPWIRCVKNSAYATFHEEESEG